MAEGTGAPGAGDGKSDAPKQADDKQQKQDAGKEGGDKQVDVKALADQVAALNAEKAAAEKKAAEDKAAADAAAEADRVAKLSEAQKAAEKMAALEASLAEERGKRAKVERDAALERLNVLPEYRDLIPPTLEGKALDDFLAARPAMLKPKAPVAPDVVAPPKGAIAQAAARGSTMFGPEYLATLQAGRPK